MCFISHIFGAEDDCAAHLAVYNQIENSGGVSRRHPALTAAFRVTERRLRIIDFVVQQRKIQAKASLHQRPSS